MQRLSNCLSRSKSALLLVFVAAGVSLAIPACKKDDNTSSDAGLSQSDMNDVLVQSIASPQSGSVVVQIDQATAAANSAIGTRKAGAKISDVLTELCGVKHEVNFPLSGTADSITFDMSLYYNWMVNCSNQVAQNIEFDFSGHTNLTTPRFEAKDSLDATLQIGGLDSDSANFVINETYDNSGSIVSKVKDQKSYTSLVHFVSSDIKVSKETRMIISGTATVKITGATASGKSFSYEGTIVFSGNKKAKFTTSGGMNVDLSWN